ncbi:MAG: DUF5129 domain-containing protein [Micrococcus sp.]|nr:DUF5129 domain-containing protein [Micrococcus sp.]
MESTQHCAPRSPRFRAPASRTPRARSRRAGLSLAAALTLGLAPAAVPAVTLAVPVVGAIAATMSAAPSASALTAQDVTLADTAGIIDPAQLERDLASIDFYEPTHVVVYTERGPSMRDLDDAQAAQEFNGRVLAYARDNHPEWLSEDGQKWADGLMIFALDPDNRMSGVYLGEDRHLGASQRDAVRNAAAPSAREAKWTDAVVAAVEQAASLINRPWYAEPGVWIGGGTAVLGAGAVGGAVVMNRSSKRRRTQGDLDAAERHLTNVTLDMDATEVNASTVPTDNRHGATLMEKFRGFRSQSSTLRSELDELRALPEKQLHQPEPSRRAADLRRSAEKMDYLDDAIAAANTFLNRYPGWEAAWDLQTEPLREDLDRVDSTLDDAPGAVRRTHAAQALSSFTQQAQATLTQLGGDLKEQRITPAAALDEVESLRERLTAGLEALSEDQVRLYGKTEQERELMREQMQRQRQSTRRSQGSILDTTHDVGFFWTVAAYSMGYRAGRSQIQQQRQSQSSSSGGTGYGAGGGSFSGTGSSGRF